MELRSVCVLWMTCDKQLLKVPTLSPTNAVYPAVGDAVHRAVYSLLLRQYAPCHILQQQ
jgi:hypothetical protein